MSATEKPKTETPRFSLMNTGTSQNAPETPVPPSQVVQETPQAAAAPAEPATGPVRVISGAHEQVFPNLAGRSVSSVRASLREVFNISKDAQARVGSQNVGEDYNLRPDDNLEFVRPVGQKG